MHVILMCLTFGFTLTSIRFSKFIFDFDYELSNNIRPKQILAGLEISSCPLARHGSNLVGAT